MGIPVFKDILDNLTNVIGRCIGDMAYKETLSIDCRSL